MRVIDELLGEDCNRCEGDLPEPHKLAQAQSDPTLKINNQQGAVKNIPATVVVEVDDLEEEFRKLLEL